MLPNTRRAILVSSSVADGLVHIAERGAVRSPPDVANSTAS